ncbi:polyprenyl diphosphate synthase [Chloroflexota bacterium]
MENTIRLPEHVAFITDGNGRWAERQGLSRLEGHRTGVEKARAMVRTLNRHGINYATIYAFSTENWSRPVEEIHGLFHMLEEMIEDEARELHQNGVKLRHLGRLEGLSAGLRQAILNALELTKNNTGMTVSLALNYGGRGEILDALRRLLAERISPLQIDEELLARYLYTSGLPDIDLVIRTGGEYRISNFMLWQAAYSEYYFTDTLWPDFTDDELALALQEYSHRQRRFGGLGEEKSASSHS